MRLTFTRKLNPYKVARTTQYVYVCMSCGNKTTIMTRTCTKCGGGTVKMPGKPLSFLDKIRQSLRKLGGAG